MTGAGWLGQPAAFAGGLLHPAVFPWVSLAIGLCIGSFLNVLIHRLPRMMERAWREECAELARTSGAPDSPPSAPETYNLFVPRSRCPSCGKGIAPLQNIPLFSFVFLRGRCASCKTWIGLKYPLVELLAGIGAAYAAWRFGASFAALGAALFIWFTIALAFIDQETGFLPDDLTLPLVWLGLILNLNNTFAPLSQAVIGAAAGYLFLWSLNALFKLARGMDGMGYGDFKLTAAVGAFLGWKALPFVILLSSVVGLVFGTLQMFSVRRGWDWKFKFHFGPYLAIAGIVAVLWGASLKQRFPVLGFYL
jgi:leader peptidase (prepilin peptidase) / N-methyltransferase